MTTLHDRAADPVDPDDRSTNPSTAPSLGDVAAARFSRRALLGGGMVAAAGFLTTSVTGMPSAAAAPGRPGRPGRPAPAGPVLGFRAVGPSTADDVVVPRGYTARPFIPWGTPLTGSMPAFRPGLPTDGGNTADEQAMQLGMHHDGMTYFPTRPAAAGNTHGVLVVNHEYTDESYLQTGTATEPAESEYTAEMVRKSQAAHGVSVVEVRSQGRNGWTVVRSGLNRRITANTPMTFDGPAAGSPLLRTAADPAGRTPLGTLNNCGNGETPWGTYLTCEENFNQYFRVDRAGMPEEELGNLDRYGVGAGGTYPWAEHDPRFRVTPGDPHEPNRFGWIVEIDPMDPRSTPVKHTALGRLKHEDASAHTARDGRLVVYMGDDQANEYVYKFVSARPWEAMRRARQNPLSEGTLYVARFNEDGSGDWLALVHGRNGLTAANGFADQADVLVRTRQAAAAVGATPMDRPEWTAVDPVSGTVYLTLTNNSGRTVPNGPNPRVNNRMGQIVRWDEAGGDHTAVRFAWDLFLIAGNGVDDGSTIDAEDAFGSPDGLWVDPDRRAWIQTDGRQPIPCNDQMLAADATVPFGTEPEVRRFLVGVTGAEVTGIATTPDRRTMFVNLQHPTGTWPRLDGVTVPRSGTVVITKDDGGVIGS